jgi:hypothetical protein
VTISNALLPRTGLWLPALFTLTIFASALLLFFVQPLFTRMVLPQIGGAAAVWTTAMLFFQAVLIAGYLYAHLITRHLAPRHQVALHAVLLLAALAFLPLAVPGGWRYDPAAPVVTQTLWLYALGVGLPFAVLSANAPLIQAWYGRTGGPSSADPYFLYAASNLGSFIALLGFPLAAEPLFGVSAISLGWSGGFVLLAGLLVACGLVAARSRALPEVQAARAEADATPWPRLALWAFLAFLPSSLMLCVTTKISTDLGSFPLVWVVPLALYLLTFVLVFSAASPLTSARLRWVFPPALAVLAYFSISTADRLGDFALLTAAFFLASLMAHRLLFETRPGRGGLTLFYVVMSVGGALGGLFNSIVAPIAFDRLTEFPVTVVLMGLLLLRPVGGRSAVLQAVLGLALGVLALYVFAGLLPGLGGADRALRSALAVAILLAVLVALPRAGVAGAVLAAVLILPPAFLIGRQEPLVDRSFFGLHLVRDAGGLRLYSNGTTVHGAERLERGAGLPQPLYYYHPQGALAQVVERAQAAGAGRFGIVGLGVGALACYARPGEDWHFYEIDQKVVDIALDPTLFTFMTRCAPGAPIHLGDARIVLEQETGPVFDLLVIDAYSSDAIPVHLATQEAVALYLTRLAPDGVLVFHISNRFYDLSRPLARIAAALGLEARHRIRQGAEITDAPYDVPSSVVVLARSRAALGALAEDPAWKALTPGPEDPLWTDDHANLLSILK